MIFVLLSQNAAGFSVLRKVVGYLHIAEPIYDDKPGGGHVVELVVSRSLSDSRSSFDSLFHVFARLLEKDKLTILVSEVKPFKLNPLQNLGWESLLAMLIMAFPETRWLFGTVRGLAELGRLAAEQSSDDDRQNQQKQITNLEQFRCDHGIGNIFKPYINPLFDSNGLRNWVRCRILEDNETWADGSYLPRRIQNAIALDEEEPYSILHAYASYRFGFRGKAVGTRILAEYLLGKEAVREERDEPTLVFEDIYLNFRDGGKGLSDLAVTRKKELPFLEYAEHRIFVTSGQRLQGDQEKWASNMAYLNEQKAHGRHIKKLQKPYAGIFHLWEAAELMIRLRWPSEKTGRIHRGTGAGFLWPPEKEEFTESFHGHSAPGILLTIATSLINRARKFRNKGVRSVTEAVRGAVIANDALELLGGRTPTESIEALSLKHQFEVLAECQFSGVEFHLELAPRLEELRHDVQNICRWFDPKKRRIAAWNAEMSIHSSLMRIFQEYAQFDEQQVCINQARHLHNKLWMHQKPLRFMAWPILRYLEYLLASFPRFLLILVGWIILLGGLYSWANNWNSNETLTLLSSNESSNILKSIKDAITSFFCTGSPSPEEKVTKIAYTLVSCSAIVSGFGHLGVFIAHLYSILSRK